jgi:hypothetical protein
MSWRRIEDTTAVIFRSAKARMMKPVHLLAACPNRSYLKAHGFGLDRYIEHPLILEQGMAISPRDAIS